VVDGIEYIKSFISDYDYTAVLAQYTSQCLMEDMKRKPLLHQNAYTSILYEQYSEAREHLRKYNDVLRKYVDETYHIENDDLYSLDVRRFDIAPDNYITGADDTLLRKTRERFIRQMNTVSRISAFAKSNTIY